MRILIGFFSAFLMISCAHKSTKASLEAHSDINKQEDYTFVNTEDNRYIMFKHDDTIVDEIGAEDVRVITTNYDRRSEREVVIRYTSSHLSSQRVLKLVELLTAFGVAEDDIAYSFIREELQPYDDLIQLSLRPKSKRNFYAAQ